PARPVPRVAPDTGIPALMAEHAIDHLAEQHTAHRITPLALRPSTHRCSIARCSRSYCHPPSVSRAHVAHADCSNTRGTCTGSAAHVCRQSTLGGSGGSDGFVKLVEHAVRDRLSRAGR